MEENASACGLLQGMVAGSGVFELKTEDGQQDGHWGGGGWPCSIFGLKMGVVGKSDVG
jgi:hypothetical protein